MAILSPAELPIIRTRSEPMKKYVLSKLGHPVVKVELEESQFETVFRAAGDFIAGYFPREQRLAVFYTSPLKNTYPMPKDAFWIQEVHWDPSISNFNDIFGAGAFIANSFSAITGSHNFLLDFHLLSAYRKFTQKLLGEGHWEVINEVDGESKDQLIRLYPTPKSVFPVTVLYVPMVNYFRSPQARLLAYDMMLAEAKIMLGMSRRKVAGMPTPDGGAINYDGADLVQEGEKAREELTLKALNLGEPYGIWAW